MNGAAGLILWIGVMALLFYFMVFRPQKKQEKAARILRNSITPGDTIETIGGFTGKVLSVKEDDVVFEVGADKTKLVVKKWAVRYREPAANNKAVPAAAEKDTEKKD